MYTYLFFVYICIVILTIKLAQHDSATQEYEDNSTDDRCLLRTGGCGSALFDHFCALNNVEYELLEKSFYVSYS